tara:strand:+ start:8563 stop:9087 length:525 start_codon:yes stop_codon:yes gene_type:complete
METAMIASSVAGFGMQAVGQMQQSDAAKKAAAFNAAVQRNQAIAARQKAEFDAQRQRSATQDLLARQRAGFAASGVVLEGTPLEVLESTAEAGELDAQVIIHGGELQASGFESQSQLSRFESEAAGRAGPLAAGATLLTGAGKTALAAKKAGIKFGGGTKKSGLANTNITSLVA